MLTQLYFVFYRHLSRLCVCDVYDIVTFIITIKKNNS